jgi:hypothetical protein
VRDGRIKRSDSPPTTCKRVAEAALRVARESKVVAAGEALIKEAGTIRSEEEVEYLCSLFGVVLRRESGLLPAKAGEHKREPEKTSEGYPPRRANTPPASPPKDQSVSSEEGSGQFGRIVSEAEARRQLGQENGKLYAVYHPSSAYGLWVGRWAKLVASFGTAVQGERFFDFQEARKALTVKGKVPSLRLAF